MRHFFILTLGNFFAIAAICWPATSALAEGWGTIKGRVIYSGEQVPAPQMVVVNKDQPHCLSKGPIPNEELVVNPQNKGVHWVAVWLIPPKKGDTLPVHPNLAAIRQKTVVIDQPCCRFEPHALGMRDGQDLEAKNSGQVAHNVNWTGHPLKNPGGNVILPVGKSHVITGLKADEFPIKVACNIHGWMNAMVYVFDHPYFAITDANGSFEIKDAPAGTFNLRTRSDMGYGPGGKIGMPITVGAGKVTNVTIPYPK